MHLTTGIMKGLKSAMENELQGGSFREEVGEAVLGGLQAYGMWIVIVRRPSFLLKMVEHFDGSPFSLV